MSVCSYLKNAIYNRNNAPITGKNTTANTLVSLFERFLLSCDSRRLELESTLYIHDTRSNLKAL